MSVNMPCDVIIAIAGIWPLPGLAQPANDSAYVSMYLFVSLHEFTCVSFFMKNIHSYVHIW